MLTPLSMLQSSQAAAAGGIAAEPTRWTTTGTGAGISIAAVAATPTAQEKMAPKRIAGWHAAKLPESARSGSCRPASAGLPG